MPRYGELCSIQIQPTQIYINASQENKKAEETRPFIICPINVTTTKSDRSGRSTTMTKLASRCVQVQYKCKIHIQTTQIHTSESQRSNRCMNTRPESSIPTFRLREKHIQIETPLQPSKLSEDMILKRAPASSGKSRRRRLTLSRS
jgi:hypothetical protein